LLTVKDEKTRLFVMWKWAMKWGQLLDAVGKKEGVDMWKRADGTTWANRKSVLQAPAQYVRKSVGAYLSSYISKNAPEPGNNIVGECMNPVRWWGCSRPLLARLGELTDTIEKAVCDRRHYNQVLDRVWDGFSGLASGFHRYSDKLDFARVFVAFDEESSVLFNEFWRDFKCKANLGIVVNSSTGCLPWQPLPEMATSGQTSIIRQSLSMRGFADQIRVCVHFSLSFGRVPKLSRMQWRNTVLKRIKKRMTLPMWTWNFKQLCL
jgi:hypothetical protein